MQDPEGSLSVQGPNGPGGAAEESDPVQVAARRRHLFNPLEILAIVVVILSVGPVCVLAASMIMGGGGGGSPPWPELRVKGTVVTRAPTSTSLTDAAISSEVTQTPTTSTRPGTTIAPSGSTVVTTQPSGSISIAATNKQTVGDTTTTTRV